jgi:hypothetical protein
MGRTKKISLKLNPEWMFSSDPIDFEYNKYTLLGYLQKCEKGFENLEIYPDFIELSLHLANVQSLNKENTLLLTDKKFESYDDELLVTDLYPKKPRPLEKDEEEELVKTIRYSGTKLFDAFNVAKSIWNLSYDNIEITLKRNKSGLYEGVGYIYFNDLTHNKFYVWQYELKTPSKTRTISKAYLKKIFDRPIGDKTITEIISENTKFKGEILNRKLPIFEAKSDREFPLEKTFIPIVKRKLMSYVYQVITLEEESKNLNS